MGFEERFKDLKGREQQQCRDVLGRCSSHSEEGRGFEVSGGSVSRVDVICHLTDIVMESMGCVAQGGQKGNWNLPLDPRLGHGRSSLRS